MFGGSSTSIAVHNIDIEGQSRPSDWIMNLVTGANPMAQINR